MRTVTRLALAFAFGGLSVAAPAFASGVTPLLNPASPQHYFGGCPGTIKFTGTIGAKAGIVKYRWFRSDGATGPVQTLAFSHAERLPISDTWTLGAIPGLPTYSGWEAVHILSPAGPDSNKAVFDLRCVQRAAPPPRK